MAIYQLSAIYQQLSAIYQQLYPIIGGTREEIQLPLNRFSDSSRSSLIHSWLMPGRVFGHQNLAAIPMDRQLPDGDWSTNGQVLSSVAKGWLFTLGQGPTLA